MYRSYAPRDEAYWPDEEAERMIESGVAERVPDRLEEMVKIGVEFGIGFLSGKVWLKERIHEIETAIRAGKPVPPIRLESFSAETAEEIIEATAVTPVAAQQQASVEEPAKGRGKKKNKEKS